MQQHMEQDGCDPIQINSDKSLGCIMWADDVLLMSKSEEGLKNMLKILKSYTEENGLTLNIEKTKVMIFNRNGRHMRRNFNFGKNKIETTKQYKYLGFLITPSGEITTGLKDLKDRAQKAFFSMKFKLGPAFKKKSLITIQLFNALVKPNLFYASDFWGILNLPQNNPIENLHISFCKQLLGVQKQTTTIGILLELGQISLSIDAKKMAIKNWGRISNRVNCNNMVILSYENALSLNLTWPKKIKDSLSEIGMLENFLSKTVNIYFKAFQRMKDIFHQNSFSQITDERSKLRTYGLVKSKIGFEEYLNEIHNINDRVAFTKFRLSNHHLRIEVGRHNKIPKHLRFCPFCPTLIEDEIHFLLECKMFQRQRDDFINIISDEVENFFNFNTNERFCILMSDHTISVHTAKYISRMLEVRSYLLKNHKNNI